jgi:hypothetical protein
MRIKTCYKAKYRVFSIGQIYVEFKKEMISKFFHGNKYFQGKQYFDEDDMDQLTISERYHDLYYYFYVLDGDNQSVRNSDYVIFLNRVSS